MLGALNLPMKLTHLPIIANVRFLVGALGERRGWWPGRFTDEASRRSLELLFPRTAARAALESVVELGRREHDERLGPNAFHLFRLPVHLEDRLMSWLARPEATVSWPPMEADAIRGELGRVAPALADVGSGPVRLDVCSRLNQISAFEKMVGVYLAADRVGGRVIPYFED
jgi:hypothetical protein